MRTKGATSTVAVTLKQLNEMLQPNAIVFISRRQADQLGILGQAVKLTRETIQAGGNQPAVEEIIPVQEIQ